MSDGPDPACYSDPDQTDTIDPDDPRVDTRDPCTVCFPDGEIDDDVDELVIGLGYGPRSFHLTDDRDVDYGAHLRDSRSSPRSIWRTIGAEDFGPEDLDELARSGGDA